MDQRIYNYFYQNLSKEEKINLLEEIESNEELKKEMISFQNTMGILSFDEGNINLQESRVGWEKIKNRKTKKKLLRFVLRASTYAAVACALILITWNISLHLNLPSEIKANSQILTVPAGQRAHLILPDGTSVWLNAGSVLKYPSVFINERRIFVEGEAYFNVMSNKNLPFIVSSGKMDIECLGTEFNVYSYPENDYISTALLEGSIRVYNPEDNSESFLLEPFQELIYMNGNYHTDTFEETDFLLWKEGVYSFNKETLDAIIKKLELYYDTQIIVMDPDILKYEYTGKFRQRDGIYEILRIIQKIHPFKIVKDEEKNEITLS